MHRFTCISVAILTAVTIVLAEGDGLSPPKFKASLVCFNGKADSSSGCRITMAKIERGLRVVSGKLTCGFEGAVSEITWTYRGQKDGKDCYHMARRFPAGTNAAKTTHTDVNYDGVRQILFEDQAQCIVIEPQPDGE